MMRCRRSREELLAMGLSEEEVELLMREEAVRWQRAANEVKTVRRVVSADTEIAVEKAAGCGLSVVYGFILALGALCAWPIALPGIILRYFWLKANKPDKVGDWAAYACISGVLLALILIGCAFGA